MVIDFQEDSGNQEVPKGGIEKVVQLANKLRALESKKDNIEATLAETSKQIRELESEILPGLMASLGLKDFTLDDGNHVLIKPITAASLPSASAIEKEKDAEKRALARMRLEAGFKFLRENGAGALIKNVLVADLGKNSEELKAKIMETMQRLNIPANISATVHPASLTSWVKERLEAGQDVDFDTFAVFTGSKAVIEVPKAKKTKSK